MALADARLGTGRTLKKAAQTLGQLPVAANLGDTLCATLSQRQQFCLVVTVLVKAVPCSDLIRELGGRRLQRIEVVQGHIQIRSDLGR